MLYILYLFLVSFTAVFGQLNGLESTTEVLVGPEVKLVLQIITPTTSSALISPSSVPSYTSTQVNLPSTTVEPISPTASTGLLFKPVGHRFKRAKRSGVEPNGINDSCFLSEILCPTVDGSFACVSPNDVESCGGCANQGGVDCFSIKGADTAHCEAGKCVITHCSPGYTYIGDECFKGHFYA